MMSDWICPACRANNGGGWATCEGCGKDRPEPERPAAPGPKRCYCGGPRLASGICERTGGYPATYSCHFACPICRARLDWSGGCDQCHGCTSGRREDWTFPGDRYELTDGHWHWVDGPRKACTPEENAAGFAKIRAILSHADHLDAKRSDRGLVVVDPAIRAELERRARPRDKETR